MAKKNKPNLKKTEIDPVGKKEINPGSKSEFNSAGKSENDPASKSDDKPISKAEIMPAGKAEDEPEVMNPFPGLRPFKLEESHLFFGREGQTDEVLQKLSDHHFVSIIGHCI